MYDYILFALIQYVDDFCFYTENKDYEEVVNSLKGIFSVIKSSSGSLSMDCYSENKTKLVIFTHWETYPLSWKLTFLQETLKYRYGIRKETDM